MNARSDRLSRYTPAIFACAFLHLLLAELAVTAGLTWPAQPLLAPMTLVVVHLTTLGWLTLLMFGALFQFVPVISNRPLPSQGVVFAVLMLFESGLWMMLMGFVGLGSALGVLLPLGGALVVIAVLLGMADLLPPLWGAARRSLPARCVLVGLGALVVTVGLGLCFALILRLSAVAAYLGPLLGGGLSAHLLAGLVGWFTLTAMGVSYKLLPMFLLAPEERGALGETVFVLMAAGSAVAVTGAVCQSFLHSGACDAIERTGLVLVGAGTILYLIDMVRPVSRTFRIGAASCLLATLMLGREYWYAWCLHYVIPAIRDASGCGDPLIDSRTGSDPVDRGS